MTERVKGKESVEYANILDHLGSLCKDQDRYNESLSYFITSLYIHEKLKGK
jgi:hypothetical protein